MTVPVDEQIICNQLDSNPDMVWSLLLATGYLKIIHAMTEKEAADLDSKRMYTMALTNLEVRRMFSKMVQGWFAQTGGLSGFAKPELEDAFYFVLLRRFVLCFWDSRIGQEHQAVPAKKLR